MAAGIENNRPTAPLKRERVTLTGEIDEHGVPIILGVKDDDEKNEVLNRIAISRAIADERRRVEEAQGRGGRRRRSPKRRSSTKRTTKRSSRRRSRTQRRS
jgi:hypothetical protein